MLSQAESVFVIIHQKLFSSSSSLHCSFKTPDLEGMPNLTALDFQIKNLRDKTVLAVREAARTMLEKATDVKEALSDIEGWLERLQQLAEEVAIGNQLPCLNWASRASHSLTLVFVLPSSLRTACRM